jgi:hypothetical protein
MFLQWLLGVAFGSLLATYFHRRRLAAQLGELATPAREQG